MRSNGSTSASNECAASWLLYLPGANTGGSCDTAVGDRIVDAGGKLPSTGVIKEPERPLEAVFAAVCCRAPAMAPIITAKGDVASARVCIAAGGVYFEPGATCVRAPGDDDDDDQPYFQLTCTSP